VIDTDSTEFVHDDGRVTALGPPEQRIQQAGLAAAEKAREQRDRYACGRAQKGASPARNRGAPGTGPGRPRRAWTS
jgi:hypothetical protein